MKNKIKKFNKIISEPLIASMTGFGFIWLYLLNDWNLWFSIVIGLFISALVSRILLK